MSIIILPDQRSKFKYYWQKGLSEFFNTIGHNLPSRSIETNAGKGAEAEKGFTAASRRFERSSPRFRLALQKASCSGIGSAAFFDGAQRRVLTERRMLLHYILLLGEWRRSDGRSDMPAISVRAI